uniref:Uncharacterized protein n=1 Tax=Octactis speculum TaxID=3111310 RepID=A0A7S2MIN1_9STRA
MMTHHDENKSPHFFPPAPPSSPPLALPPLFCVNCFLHQSTASANTFVTHDFASPQTKHSKISCVMDNRHHYSSASSAQPTQYTFKALMKSASNEALKALRKKPPARIV